MKDRAAVMGSASCGVKGSDYAPVIWHFWGNSAKYVIKISYVLILFVAQSILYKHYNPAKTLFSLLIIQKTISASPLARLQLIDCWRCIVFLFI